MKLNRRQKDGLASMFDNISLASAGGAVVGSFVESKVTIINAIILMVFALVLITLACLLRSGDQ